MPAAGRAGGRGWGAPGRGRLAAALLAAHAAGCGTPSISIEARQDPAVPPRPSPSLFVVSQVARADGAWAESFAKAMGSALERAGVRHEVQTRNPLAVQSDRSAYAEALAKFKPDLWLVVEPGDATVDREGRNLSRRFEAGLFRHGEGRGERLLVWRASVAVRPGGAFVQAGDMGTLASAIVNKLRADGFLRAAPPPVAEGAYGPGFPLGGGLKQE